MQKEKEYDVCFAMDDENHGFFRVVTVMAKSRHEARRKGVQKVMESLQGGEVAYYKKVHIHQATNSPWRAMPGWHR